MAVSVERAAQNALAAWLASQLSDCTVSSKWPAAASGLPDKAITILRSGPRVDDMVEPTVVATNVIHVGVTPAITTVDATDQASANTLLNACATSYAAHRPDVVAHLVADTTNIVVAPTATDLASSEVLAIDLIAKINAHEPSATFHTNGDTVDAISVPTPIDLASVKVAANAIKASLNKHYAARIYTWLLRACRMPLQLDVWAKYDLTRDDIMARLESALNANPALSAGIAGPQMPFGHGTLLQFAQADGIAGFVDTWFDAPTVEDSTESVQRAEYRATYRGTAAFNLTLKIQSARMVKIVLQQTTSEKSPAPTTLAPDNYTVSWANTPDGYVLSLS